MYVGRHANYKVDGFFHRSYISHNQFEGQNCTLNLGQEKITQKDLKHRPLG